MRGKVTVPSALPVRAPQAFDLSAKTDTTRAGKPFEAFTHSEDRPAGVFVDMNGNEVSITRADLDTIVKNTQALLSTSPAGLPIDGDQDHDKGRAYGWVKGVELVGDVVKLIPEWTELGVDAISKKIRQFFSVTLDLANMCITGGSLTNWPAVTGLKPIELSQERKFAMTPEEMQALIEALTPKIQEIATAVCQQMMAGDMASKEAAPTEDKPASAALSAPISRAEFAQAVRAETMREMAEFARKQELQAYAAKVAQRSALDGAALGEALCSLPADQVPMWKAIIDTAASTVDFSTRGHSRPTTQKKQLPAHIAADLRSGKRKVADFTSPMLAGALGGDSIYDYELPEGAQ